MYPYPDKTEKNEENDGEPLMNVSSDRDCTGLIPANPQSEEEFRSYEDVYDFLPNAVPPQPRERS
ncbi:MAG: hypothetical protein MSH49_06385 [[Eubacterium] saphenum]|nr:hypothetical protein [[Eubacterium] saphenum]